MNLLKFWLILPLEKNLEKKFGSWSERGKFAVRSLWFGHLQKNAEIKYFFLHYDQRGREFEYQLLRGALEFAKSLGCKRIITAPKLLGIGEVNIFDEFGFKKLEKSRKCRQLNRMKFSNNTQPGILKNKFGKILCKNLISNHHGLIIN